MSRFISKNYNQRRFGKKRGSTNLLYFTVLHRPANFSAIVTPNNQVMIQLLRLIMMLENSRFVGWVTLNAYRIFWSCVFLNLFFNTMELVAVINRKNGEIELNSSEEMIEANWLMIIIDHYWMSVIFFSLIYFGIRMRRQKKGLE